MLGLAAVGAAAVIAAGVMAPAGGSAGAVVPEAAAEPALINLLQSVASAERAAGSWRSGPDDHPFGVTAAGYVIPVQKFTITSYFRNTDPVHSTGVHSGVDFATGEGARIVAVTGGVVVEAGWMGAAGISAVVKSEDGHKILYGHMSRLSVAGGDEVRAGQELGRIGSTGNSTGPHLHLQVSDPRGELVDPVVHMGLDHLEVAQYGRT